MIYHTNPGNCHTDKIARAGARQARALGGCWLPAGGGAEEVFCGFLSGPTRGCRGGWVGGVGGWEGSQFSLRKKRKQLRESAQNLRQSHLQST